MSPAIEEATQRLGAALGRLEAALGRRSGGDGRHPDLETELQLMQDDRARLSVELESAAARLGRVEAVAGHVGRRLETAISAVGDVLTRAEASAGRDRDAGGP